MNVNVNSTWRSDGAESEVLPQNADFTIYCPPAVTTRHYGIYCVFDGPR